MAAKRMPVLAGVLREQRRQVAVWCLTLALLSAMYISFYPSMGGTGMQDLVDNMPEQLSTALGYDRLGTAAGWLTSTIYAFVVPVLLLVFAIATGSRLIAGDEESGDLELEAAAPLSRRQILIQRLLALWLATLTLVVTVTLVSYALVLALDMGISVGNIIAASTGLLLLVIGMGTVALAVGAVTGRRVIALGATAGLAVLAYVLDALGRVAQASWMNAISPFSWYLEHEPLTNGFDLRGIVLLAAVPIVATAGALFQFNRRDLMV